MRRSRGGGVFTSSTDGGGMVVGTREYTNRSAATTRSTTRPAREVTAMVNGKRRPLIQGPEPFRLDYRDRDDFLLCSNRPSSQVRPLSARLLPR